MEHTFSNETRHFGSELNISWQYNDPSKAPKEKVWQEVLYDNILLGYLEVEKEEGMVMVLMPFRPQSVEEAYNMPNFISKEEVRKIQQNHKNYDETGLPPLLQLNTFTGVVTDGVGYLNEYGKGIKFSKTLSIATKGVSLATGYVAAGAAYNRAWNAESTGEAVTFAITGTLHGLGATL